MTSTLRNTLRDLAQSDAARIRDIENLTGGKVKASRSPRVSGTGTSGRSTTGGSVSGALRSGLRGLAQSDARFYRELGNTASGGSSGAGRVGGGGSSPRIRGSSGSSGSKPPRKPRAKKR